MIAIMRVVLIVDADPDLRALLAALFEGWRVLAVGSGREALHAARQALAEEGLHFLVLALRLSDMLTEEVYEAICQMSQAPVPAVVLSGALDGAERAEKIGVPFLSKPDGVEHLVELAERMALLTRA